MTKTNVSACESINLSDIYTKYHKVVLTHILVRRVNQVVAEEISNDVFIKAAKYLHTFDVNKASMPTWLKTIANSCISDYYRSSKDNYFVPVDDFISKDYTCISDNQADTYTERKELQVELERAFNGLRPEYKKVAELYFISDKSYKDIANICNLSIGNVCSTISRAKAILQKELQKQRSLQMC